MHRVHDDRKRSSGPETSGVTLHQTTRYDLFAGLMGLGVNRRNSRMIIELAQVKPGDKLLDVGCGTGNLTLTASRYAGAAGSACGIDPSPEMIQAARKKAERRGVEVDFRVGLIERIAYPEGTFDVIVSRLVIHHLPEDLKRKGFAEVFRVLRPGGLFLLADFHPPANRLLARVVSALVGHAMMQTDVRDIPPMLAEAGFVQVASGPMRAGFLAFVRGRKPTA